MHACVYLHACVCVCIYSCVRTRVYVHMFVHVCACVCTCVCMCFCIQSLFIWLYRIVGKFGKFAKLKLSKLVVIINNPLADLFICLPNARKGYILQTFSLPNFLAIVYLTGSKACSHYRNSVNVCYIREFDNISRV